MTSFVEMPEEILEMLNDKSFIVPTLTADEKKKIQMKKVADYNRRKYNNNTEYNSYKRDQAKQQYQKLRQCYIDNTSKTKI
jgi:hypothetical protein